MLFAVLNTKSIAMLLMFADVKPNSRIIIRSMFLKCKPTMLKKYSNTAIVAALVVSQLREFSRSEAVTYIMKVVA